MKAEATDAMITVCDGGIMFGNDPRERMYVKTSVRHIRNVTSMWSGMEGNIIYSSFVAFAIILSRFFSIPTTEDILT